MKHGLVFLLSITLFACTEERVAEDVSSGPIRIAVLPDQARDRLTSKYASLIEYLESSTNLDFEFSIPRDYPDMLAQFEAGRIDLAWFGGLTFVQAISSGHALPIAFRDVDLAFTSCYLVKSSDTRATISEFGGESFSFGPDLSTSGHLMPRYFMANAGLDPDKFFGSIRHSSGHDQTAIWVSNGTVALGVANCVIVQSLFESEVLHPDNVRIIETTPPYADYVWAASDSLSEDVRQSLLDALLALDASIPEHREILRSQGANAYLPAGVSDFEIIRAAAVRAGVLAEDGKK